MPTPSSTPEQRTHCGSLRAEHAGQTVRVMGWVHRRRDHGGLIFIDVRDRWGLVQVVFNPADNAEAHGRAESLRAEFVVEVVGTVRRRPAGSDNPNLPSGEVEVLAGELEVVNQSETPPFPIEDEVEVDERLRMQYRYLDLRRPRMQRNLMLRHRFLSAVRRHLDARDFVEVETPVLFKTTPEGARDYLVPSRVHPGEFYALPQSPQILKQLLMVSGFERYYQIARCFRDEDLRADRQPEFTQIDAELSFTSEEEILDLVEGMFAQVMSEIAGVELPRPFPRMAYDEAMARYGSDKPDTRFGVEIGELNEVLAATEFRVFRSVIEGGGLVAGIAVPGLGAIPRKKVDALVDRARALGAKGLAYMPVGEGVASPLSTNLPPAEQAAIAERLGAVEGDLLLMVADTPRVVREVLGQLRLELAREQGLVPEGDWKFLFITSMPLMEMRSEDGRLVSSHHPFTRPRDEDLHLLDSDPLRVRAYAYDMVVNGSELMSGSLRIYDPALQHRIFELLGLDQETIEQRFGFLLQAFRYGVPPHGGFACGVDRMAALLCGSESIREVIAFPKTQAAQDLMSGAPSPAAAEQLTELGVALRPRPKA